MGLTRREAFFLDSEYDAPVDKEARRVVFGRCHRQAQNVHRGLPGAVGAV